MVLILNNGTFRAFDILVGKRKILGKKYDTLTFFASAIKIPMKDDMVRYGIVVKFGGVLCFCTQH